MREEDRADVADGGLQDGEVDGEGGCGGGGTDAKSGEDGAGGEEGGDAGEDCL